MNVREQYALEILTTMLASNARMQNIRAAALKSGNSWRDELVTQSVAIADIAILKLAR